MKTNFPRHEKRIAVTDTRNGEKFELRLIVEQHPTMEWVEHLCNERGVPRGSWMATSRLFCDGELCHPYELIKVTGEAKARGIDPIAPPAGWRK